MSKEGITRLILFLVVIYASCGFGFYETELEELEDKVLVLETKIETLEEDIDINEAILNSHLNNTLSKDMGGDY